MKNKFLLFISVILGTFLFYGVGFAASPLDLKAQIQNLLKQIEELQKQLKESEGGDEEWCYDFNKNLRVGDNNKDVSYLIGALIKEDLLSPGAGGGGAAGETIGQNVREFDEEVASAVSGFQEKYAREILTPNGLKHGTGFVGKSTRAKLNKLYGCGESKDEEKTQSFEGMLTPQGESIYMWGSHKIKVNNTSYLVQAGNSRVFSDLKKNENKKVKIIGKSRYYDLEGGFWGITAEKVVSESISSITVLSPNGGETLKSGETFEIKWNQTQNTEVTLGLINKNLPGEVEDIDFYSKSIGDVKGVKGENKYVWQIPSNLRIDNNYKICVAGYFEGESGTRPSAFEDCSDNVFRINGGISEQYIKIISPNGGENWKLEFQGGYAKKEIKWTYNNGNNVDGYLYRTSGKPIYQFCEFDKCADIFKINFSGSALSGELSILIPENIIAADDYKVKLSLGGSGDKEVAKDESDRTFSVSASKNTNPSVTVISPNGGEKWAIGSTQTISWSYNNLNNNDALHTIVNIELWGVNNNKVYFIKNYGNYNDLITTVGKINNYNLTIPVHPLNPKGGVDYNQNIQPGDYRIYIEGQYPNGEEHSSIINGSSGSFSIVK